MVKYLLAFLFLFTMLSSFSLAKNNEGTSDAKLKAEYGQDLTKASFFLRFSFEKSFHKDWKESSYVERRAFLKNYDTELATEQAQEKADANTEAEEERERILEKKQAQRQEKDKLKAEQAEAKAQEREEKQQEKNINDLMKEQQQDLQRM